MKNVLLGSGVVVCCVVVLSAQAKVNPTDPQPTCRMCPGTYIPLSELVNELNGGFPFTGTLGPLGSFPIGPFGGLPSGLQFFALAMNLVGPAVPGTTTPAISYTIP